MKDSPLHILQFILPAYMFLVVGKAAFNREHARTNWSIIKAYRPIHFLTTLGVISAVLAAATLLIVYVPFLDENPILWVFSKLSGLGDGKGGDNIIFAGLQWKIYAILFLPVLLFAVPSLAMAEENMFRKGTIDWPDGCRRSLRFGLAHIVVLIPLGAALALSIGGLWFTHQYFKGGVHRSTVYHAAYNTTLVSILFISVLLT